MKKRQRKKNWVKAGRPALMYLIDGQWAISRHREFADRLEDRQNVTCWSFAPEFKRQDTRYTILPEGQVEIV